MGYRGSQLSENIGPLKMAAEDGKMRLMEVADTPMETYLTKGYSSCTWKKISKSATPFS